MQSDSDSNKKIKDGTPERQMKKAGGTAAAGSIKGGVRLIGQRIRRFADACENVSDAKKAAVAVLVLVISAAVLFTETGAFQNMDAGREDSENYFVKCMGPLETLKSTSVEEIQPYIEQRIDDAEEILDLALEKQTKSLREEYRELLDRGQGAYYQPDSKAERRIWEEVRAERREELREDPFLILVNKWHYLPSDYKVDPITLPNGQMISNECYEPLMQMLEDCSAAGGRPIVCSGYRPHEKQVYLFDEQINRWLYAGYGQEESEELASMAVAVPGTSEHELGLAADIYSSENMSLDESQVDTFTQQWLMENCWKYGFVLRYPRAKSDITGIIFEPWHYRYVGYEHARRIHEADICLEEYLDETEHPEKTEETEKNDITENAG